MSGPHTTCPVGKGPRSSPTPVTKRIHAMKTLIRATTKPRRSFVPVASFEFESFEVRVRRITRHKPLPMESFRRMNIHRPSRQFKTMPQADRAVQRAKIFLPSPSLQGHGLMCLHLGARPVNHPAALSSRHSGLRSQSYEHPVRRVRLRNETKRRMLVASARLQPAASTLKQLLNEHYPSS